MNNLSRCLPCDGVKVVTPLPIFNRPGLPALNYRIGSHSTFFQSLLARISTFTAEELADLSRTLNERNHRRTTRQNPRASQVEHPLRDWLTTRDKTDPGIALLDAWAVLADVLTFYQERIANEGYLRTAVERRSIEQLARLTGYRLRPGVSSTVYLAFEVEDAALQPNFGTPPSSSPPTPVLIPAGTAAKSVPVPGSNEEPQTFETSRPLSARKEWNEIRPRLTQPKEITAETVRGLETLYFKGLGLRLEVNDYLAVLPTPSSKAFVHRITEIEEDSKTETTKVTLRRNSLSVEPFIQAVENLINAFPATPLPPHPPLLPNLPPDVVGEIRDRILAAFTALIIRSNPSLTLVELDSEFEAPSSPNKEDMSWHYFVCDQMGDDGPIRQISKDAKVAAVTLQTNLLKVELDRNGTKVPLLESISKDFSKDVSVLLRQLKREDEDIVDPILKAVSGPMSNADMLARLKHGLRRLVTEYPLTAIGQRKYPVLAVEPLTKIEAAQGRLFKSVGVLDFDKSNSPAAEGLTVASIDLSAGDTLELTSVGYEMANVAPGRWTVKTAAVPDGMKRETAQQALSNIKVTPAADGFQRVVVTLHSLDTKQPIASAASQYFSGPDGPRPAATESIEASLVYRRKEHTNLDPKFQITPRAPAMGEPEVKVTIRVLHSPAMNPEFALNDPDYQLKQDDVDKSLYEMTQLAPLPDGERRLRLEAALRKLTIAPQTLDPCSLRIQVIDTDKSVLVVELLYDVLPVPEPVDNGLTTFLAEAHAALMNGREDVAANNRRFETFKEVNANSDYWSKTDAREILYLETASLLAFLDAGDGSNPAAKPNRISASSARISSDLKKTGKTLTVLDIWRDRIDKLKADVETVFNKTRDILERWCKAWAEQCLWLIGDKSVANRGMNSKPITETNTSYFLGRVAADLSAVSGSLVDFSAKLYDHLDKIEAALVVLAKRMSLVDGDVPMLRNRLMTEMNVRRNEFLRQAFNTIDANDALFGQGGSAGLILQGMKQKFRDRLNFLQGVLTTESEHSAEKTCAACTGNCGAEADLCVTFKCLTKVIKLAVQTADPATNRLEGELRTILGGLSGKDKDALKRIVDDLDGLAILVAPHALNGTEAFVQTSPRSVGDVILGLDRIRQSADAGARTAAIRELTSLFFGASDFLLQVANLLDPAQRAYLFEILKHARVDDEELRPVVYVFRRRANLFGWNAPELFESVDQFFERVRQGVRSLDDGGNVGNIQQAKDNLFKLTKFSKALEFAKAGVSFNGPADEAAFESNLKGVFGPLPHSVGLKADEELGSRAFLDGEFKDTTPNSVIGFLRPTPPSTGVVSGPGEIDPDVHVISSVVIRPRNAYGLHSVATIVDLPSRWWDPYTENDSAGNPGRDGFDVLKSTTVYCDAESLVLAEEPISKNVGGSDEIELDEFIGNLDTARPVIVSGAPEVVVTETNVEQSEVAIIRSIKHKMSSSLYGDRFHTTLQFDRLVKGPFLRPNTRLRANVVEATHGETQRETLGSGNSALEFQKFPLKRTDLSQLSAPTTTGVKSALAVRVNNVEWEERPDLKDASDVAKVYATKTDDAQRTTVLLGDGVNGARVPTGLENVRAEYRTGLGRKGNVGPGQINQLLGAALGVNKVNNPLAAKGGANPESRDEARSHSPLAVTAMDRLVSVQDFEDFARTYAGIGKASASLLQGAVHVTIAGFDPDPIGSDNPLFRNLKQAISLFGDPAQRFELHDREASLLILVAGVKIAPKYQWDVVQPKIREALLRRFHYDRSDLGQDVLMSDAVAVIQGIEGVLYVDVNSFDAVRQDDVSKLAAEETCVDLRSRIHVKPARFTSANAEKKMPSAKCLKAKKPPADETPAPNANNRNRAANAATTDTQPPNAPDVPQFRPAQLCYLTPDIPDTLILELIP